jgi:hypothetical protein
MTPAFIETFLCNWCSRHRPKFRIHKLASNQIICDYCLDWHNHALEFLGGAPPRGCQACGKSWELLKAITPGDRVRMYVVPKDNFLALLCRECVKPYLPKQKQLFKGTQFGAESLKI